MNKSELKVETQELGFSLTISGLTYQEYNAFVTLCHNIEFNFDEVVEAVGGDLKSLECCAKIFDAIGGK